MRKPLKTLAVVAAIFAGAAAVSALYAHESQGPRGPMMGSGMMDQGGMMGMMGQMSGMMETCNKMMQSMMDGHGSERPNEQWKNETPGKNG